MAKVEVQSRNELWCWFEGHYSQPESIWLVTYKRLVPDRFVSTDDVLDACISFGWIDGRRKKVDDQRTMQLLSPRKAEHWSATYKRRYKRLRRAGLMHVMGEEKVSQAKQSGAWSFLDDVDALIVPDDLQLALDSQPRAHKYYECFPDSAKRDILRWIKLAKTTGTRDKRILETVEKAARNERASSTGKR